MGGMVGYIYGFIFKSKQAIADIIMILILHCHHFVAEIVVFNKKRKGQ